jgi:hypothetical protein
LPAIAFAATLLLSAMLLFLVEPMFAKMALPLLGGTAAVWNTCMVFFQAGLLAGYSYAHATTQRLGARRQAGLQVLVVGLAFLALPIRIPANWSSPLQHNPAVWLLTLLVVSVGLPFFTLSTMAPSLQLWFANTGSPHSNDPYFLYAASNVGSVVALLSYPILIEPHLRLGDQSWLWTIAYALLFVLTLCCAAMLWNSPAQVTFEAVSAKSFSSDTRTNPTAWQRLRWVAMAFVPSSLMLGVTSAITTDFPPIPLFWVVPLAIYLLSFILIFARKPWIDHANIIERLPLLLLLALFPIISKTEWPVWLAIAIDLLALFMVSMMCHGELARTRPSTNHLTEFYLWMSLGGVAGGVFNSLVAPVIFNRVLEFPLALVFAALLRPSPVHRDKRWWWLDVFLPILLGTALASLIRISLSFHVDPSFLYILVFAPALMICLSFAKRGIRFGFGVAALLLSTLWYTGPYGNVLYAGRSFFGVYRVTTDPERKYHLLIHGSTLHGLQSVDPVLLREPLSYYTRKGPVGQFFTAFSGESILRQVGVVGLGSGSLAAYGTPDQQFTFFEIDPLVERIARDPRYFTFLRDSPSRTSVILGDARLSLKRARDGQYGLIILDAFSSDAIPLHLLTRQAVKLYLSKLSEHGILLFNISNRYLDLRPVLKDLATDAGLFCMIGDDSTVTSEEEKDGKQASRWIVLARTEQDVDALTRASKWTRISGQRSSVVWTDDFSNILQVIRWWN